MLIFVNILHQKYLNSRQDDISDLLVCVNPYERVPIFNRILLKPQEAIYVYNGVKVFEKNIYIFEIKS